MINLWPYAILMVTKRRKRAGLSDDPLAERPLSERNRTRCRPLLTKEAKVSKKAVKGRRSDEYPSPGQTSNSPVKTMEKVDLSLSEHRCHPSEKAVERSEICRKPVRRRPHEKKAEGWPAERSAATGRPWHLQCPKPMAARLFSGFLRHLERRKL